MGGWSSQTLISETLGRQIESNLRRNFLRAQYGMGDLCFTMISKYIYILRFIPHFTHPHNIKDVMILDPFSINQEELRS